MSRRLWLRSIFWRKTPEDLVGEMSTGKRRTINRDEIDLALAYRRWRLPKDLRYPRAGEIYEATEEKPISVYCDPLRYDELHDLIVPAEERANEYYGSYYFSIDTVSYPE